MSARHDNFIFPPCKSVACFCFHLSRLCSAGFSTAMSWQYRFLVWCQFMLTADLSQGSFRPWSCYPTKQSICAPGLGVLDYLTWFKGKDSWKNISENLPKVILLLLLLHQLGENKKKENFLHLHPCL